MNFHWTRYIFTVGTSKSPKECGKIPTLNIRQINENMNSDAKTSDQDDGDKIFGFRPILPLFGQKNMRQLQWYQINEINDNDNFKVIRVRKMDFFVKICQNNPNWAFFGQLNAMNDFSGDYTILNRKTVDYPTLVTPGPPYIILFRKTYFMKKTSAVDIKKCTNSFMFRRWGDPCNCKPPSILFWNMSACL